MFLTAPNISFELNIAGYQFPAEETADYDSNWLVMKGVVVHPRGNWQFLDPLLLTYEVSRLADWLDALDQMPNSESTLAFIEPNLEFALLTSAETSVLRIAFALESRPPWVEVGEDWHIDFPIRGLDLTAAATSLRQQLSLYPQRARQ